MKSEIEMWQDAILWAIKHLEKNRWSVKNNATHYDLVYKAKKYPPKQVFYHAYDYFHECYPERPLPSIRGGIAINKFLTDKGFTVEKRYDIPQQNIIDQYKKLVSDGNPDEIYKWILVEKFKGRPDTDAADFGKELSEIDFNDLIDYDGVAVPPHIVREKPEEYRNAFRKLFNVNRSLEDRVIAFEEDVAAIYESVGQTLEHHHDERTIAAYLTFYKPNIYAFYEDSYYIKFCEMLRIKQAQSDLRYIHYLQLLRYFVQDYILEDQELLELKRNFLPPNAFADTGNLLLAQDILHQTLGNDRF